MRTAGFTPPALVLNRTDGYSAVIGGFVVRDPGLPSLLGRYGDNGEHVVILDAGRATLELSNPAQVELIDEVEVGRRVAPRLRLAFEVDDTASATDRLVAAGAELVAPPVVTPWGSLNARLEAPANLQITLFEEPGS